MVRGMTEFERCPVCGGELLRERVDVGSSWGGQRHETTEQVCPKGCRDTLAWTEAKEARAAGGE